MKCTMAKMKLSLEWSNSKFKLLNKQLGNLKTELEDRLYNRH